MAPEDGKKKKKEKNSFAQAVRDINYENSSLQRQTVTHIKMQHLIIWIKANMQKVISVNQI